MKTLADQFPDVHSDLEIKGYKCIAHLMTVFDKQTQMDRALELNGATSNWCRGKNVPAWTVEKRANDFITKRSLAKPEPAPVIEPVVSKAVAMDATFLVVCPPGKAMKVEKVLSLLGCEAVEV